MKSAFRIVKNWPITTRIHLIAQGVILTGAGLIFRHDYPGILVGGALFAIVAVTLVVGAALVSEPVEGEVVVEQQPQLTDVQLHTSGTYALPQGT
jgi:hypothetical protein